MTDRDTAGAELGRELSTAVVMFHEALGQRLGLSAVDQRALGLITRSGPLSGKQLAAETGLTPGAVTGLVDRLERAGYVRRVTDPTDRRRTLISAVLDERNDMTEAFAELSRDMQSLVDRYDEREIAAIVDYLTRTIEVLRRQTRRLSGQEPKQD